MLAFALLISVGILGHATGWKMPRFSQWFGAAREQTDIWCEEHAVAEAQCIECNPDLVPRGKEFGKCALHKVRDCPVCHPEAAQVKGAVARPKYDVVAALDLMPRAEPNPLCKLSQRRIQFASDEAVAKAGIQIHVVSDSPEKPMIDAITAHGEIAYDPTRVVRISSRVSGTMWEVFKSVGERVDQGEVLALVDAADIGKVKTEYANALVQVQLKSRLLAGLKMASGVVAENRLREAEAAVEEARLRLVTSEQALLNLGFTLPNGLDKLGAREIVHSLRFLGMPTEMASRLNARVATANLFPLRTPQGGVVVAVEVVTGEVIEASKVLMTVADPSVMWLTLHVRQEDSRYLALGRTVRFMPDSGGQERAGKISWISTAVEDRTRTVKVRVDLPNADGKLRSNTFGSGSIILRQEANAIVAPLDAVQWEGCCNIVFVRDKNYMEKGAPKVFHVRQVRLGAKDDRNVEILAGLVPGEVVVAQGASVLRGQLLRAKLGEG